MSEALDTAGRNAPLHTRWQLRLLGDLTLTDGTRTLQRLSSRAAAALLARLAMAPQRAHAREELIELLWPGVALDVGRNRLRQVLSTLKSLLDAPGATGAPVLQADRQALRLTADALSCDVPAFEAALRAGRLDEARALYRGELLPGFFDEWIVDERLRLAALADRLDDAPGPGRTAGTAPTGVAVAPAAAPATPAAAAYPPPRPVRPVLPHYLTHLRGADTIGARLRSEVQRQRLVTLLGPGGHGKTRLAVEVAQALSDGSGWAEANSAPRFDMVAFVPLVGCLQREEMLDALMLALRQEGHASHGLRHLAGVLAGRRTLVVLDNFEQLVDAGAPVVATLLEQNPGLHLLVTSRRALGLAGEQEFVLPPLPLPEPDAGDEAALNPAVALFVDRARAVRADFHLSSRNRDAVIALVRLLEGMPLAIELAASRVRSVPPASLLALLQAAQPSVDSDASPHGEAGAAHGNALALLSRSGPRGGSDPRHASMLAVVQWSWQMLSPEAQRLLGRLSVFAGGCTLDAVQAVCGDGSTTVALALDELVMHSMLRSDAETARFELFELIRVFAATMLPAADAPALRARHRRWLITWARALPLAAPLQQVRHELANIGTAVAGAATDGAPEDAAALVDALQGPLSDISLPQGAMRALARCADALPTAPQRATTRAFLARALFRAGNPAGATPLAEQAWAELPEAALGNGLPRAGVLARLAHLRWRMQRDAGVQAWLAEALALAEAAGAVSLMASVLATQGAMARPRDPAAAITLQRRSLALWTQAGDVQGMNTGRANLAIALAGSAAGCPEALALLDEMLASTHASGDWVQHAHGCNVRGEALTRLRRWSEAAAAYRDCVQLAFALPETLLLAYGLWNLPRALAHLRLPDTAARLMGFAQTFAPLHCGPLSRADRHDLRRVRRLCRVQLTPAALAACWREGVALTLSDAVRLAVHG
ncbi:ATP-binding protein [Aquabacterium sp.]|uniref:ATP-binding protein n=1 Tax=Aquabacterium sp. TaxID=1872578 RepID=UPI002C45FD29|nr:hypothetical protein [Aquabacterium sp.]HSW05290.1 hypothetical protein [Aquabacterium sp.]